MASSRKKQDEKNMKTLRELGTLPYNKYCFDCNQRGPTYVNVTIGSFVCTKCSGMLRGLTPPHRVKSISMATFTTEEIDLLKNRGNDYCKRIWLGLYEGSLTTDCRDEQSIRDFMVNKYERKRYYLEPSQALRNGMSAKIEPPKTVLPETKPLRSLISDPKPIRINGNISADSQRKRPESNHAHKNNCIDFIADFDKADIFSSTNNNSSNGAPITNGIQGGFANFDNNPIFDSTSTSNNINCMSPPLTMQNMNNQLNNINNVQATPVEDKYAALKDLDNQLKSQGTLDWSSGSNGSLYSSPTPTGSVYSSSSPQNSIFGSPTHGQIINSFPIHENGSVANPFANGGVTWQNNSSIMMTGVQQQAFANPFRPSEPTKMNGFTQVYQTSFFPVIENGATTAWPANPFKVGGSTNSNNPFL